MVWPRCRSGQRADVKGLLAAIVARAPNTAGRVLRELRSAFHHALDKERVPEGCDPTLGIKAPKESRYVPRDRAFTEAEWKAWLRWLPESGISPNLRDALMLTALTASRPGEAIAAKWSDIDLDAGTWRISARKRDGAHLVYLSPAATRLLKARRNGSALVFPSPTVRDKPVQQNAVSYSVWQSRQGCPVDHWTAP